VSITISVPETLSAAEAEAARALSDDCNRAEGLGLPIVPAIDEDTGLVLAHLGGELVGIAHVSFGADAEVCLCVAPRWRRRGAGRALLAEAVALAARQGAAETLIVSDLASASGLAFTRALGARRSFAEHRLELDASAVPPDPPPLPGLQIRHAGPADVAAAASVLVAAFGDPPAMVAAFVRRRIADPANRFLLGELDGRPVGTLRLLLEDGGAYLATFGVLPELHGRGVGRRILMHAIHLLRAEGLGSIRIEVLTSNASALGLYQSCGFHLTNTYGYDTLPA
jgi:ribosomal protein S18 acetylase RimI-like enzyme